MSENGEPKGYEGAPLIDHATLIDRLELVYDRATDQLRVDGKAISDEVILAMLRRAVFAYEMRLRATMAAQMAMEAQRAAADQALAQRIARGALQ